MPGAEISGPAQSAGMICMPDVTQIAHKLHGRPSPRKAHPNRMFCAMNGTDDQHNGSAPDSAIGVGGLLTWRFHHWSAEPSSAGSAYADPVSLRHAGRRRFEVRGEPRLARLGYSELG